jgi:hypothetical protein
MSLLEVYIHPAGWPVSGAETGLALKPRAETSAKYEESWTI